MIDLLRRMLGLDAGELVEASQSVEQPRPVGVLEVAADVNVQSLKDAWEALPRPTRDDYSRVALASNVARPTSSEPAGPLWWCFSCSGFATDPSRCDRCDARRWSR